MNTYTVVFMFDGKMLKTKIRADTYEQAVETANQKLGSNIVQVILDEPTPQE